MSNLPANTADKIEFRQSVLKFQEYVVSLKSDIPSKCTLTHYFGPPNEKYGCREYGRAIFMPKGATVVGKIHREGHLNCVLMGKVSVLTEFGTKHYTAPVTFVSEPGLKRVVKMEEDTIWLTVHIINAAYGENDLDKIEEEVISPSYEELGLFTSTDALKELPK